MLSDFKFHHIGYAVRDINKTSSYYIAADYTLSEVFLDVIQDVKIAFLSKADFLLIELVEALSETSPIVKTLEKSGVTPYHICYEVEDIEKSISLLKQQHYIPLFKPVEAIALGGHKICYLYNNVGLIELVNAK